VANDVPFSVQVSVCLFGPLSVFFLEAEP